MNSTSIYDSSVPFSAPPVLAPPAADVIEMQEALWQEMTVRVESAPQSWRDLAPDQRISLEGFRPLIKRIGTTGEDDNGPESIEKQDVLAAAQRYQEQLTNEAALAEDMLQQLDELEVHLKSLHSNNDTLEEMSILLSYIRLEKVARMAPPSADLEQELERQGLAILDGAARVDLTRSRPTVASQKASQKGKSQDEGAETPGDGEGTNPVQRLNSQQ